MLAWYAGLVVFAWEALAWEALSCGTWNNCSCTFCLACGLGSSTLLWSHSVLAGFTVRHNIKSWTVIQIGQRMYRRWYTVPDSTVLYCTRQYTKSVNNQHSRNLSWPDRKGRHQKNHQKTFISKNILFLAELDSVWSCKSSIAPIYYSCKVDQASYWGINREDSISRRIRSDLFQFIFKVPHLLHVGHSIHTCNCLTVLQGHKTPATRSTIRFEQEYNQIIVQFSQLFYNTNAVGSQQDKVVQFYSHSINLVTV